MYQQISSLIMHIIRHTKHTVYSCLNTMTSRRVRGKHQSKAKDCLVYPIVHRIAYRNDLQSYHCNFTLVKRDEHYKAYHIAICICKTCYMILQMIKAKLVEFLVFCNWSVFTLNGTLWCVTLWWITLSWTETMWNICRFAVYRCISDHQGGQVNIWPHRYVPSQNKRKKKKPCNHKTCIRHEEIIGLIVNVNQKFVKIDSIIMYEKENKLLLLLLL